MEQTQITLVSVCSSGVQGPLRAPEGVLKPPEISDVSISSFSEQKKQEKQSLSERLQEQH